MRSLPAVNAPMHQRGIEQNESEFFVAWYGSSLIVEPPAKDLPDGFFDEITLYRLRGLVEYLSVAQGTAQFDVL